MNAILDFAIFCPHGALLEIWDLFWVVLSDVLCSGCFVVGFCADGGVSSAGFYHGGFCLGGFCPGFLSVMVFSVGFCLGGFVRGVLSRMVLSTSKFCPSGSFVWGVLSGEILSRGFYPRVLSGGFVRGVFPGVFCPWRFCPRIFFGHVSIARRNIIKHTLNKQRDQIITDVYGRPLGP